MSHGRQGFLARAEPQNGQLPGLVFFFSPKNTSPARCPGEATRFSQSSSRAIPAITFGEFAGHCGSLMKRPKTAKNCPAVCGNYRPTARASPKDDPGGADHRDPRPYDQLGKRTRTLLWFGLGCSGNRMLLEHERYYGLGADALVTVCSWNTNVIMVWAWMLWSPDAVDQKWTENVLNSAALHVVGGLRGKPVCTLVLRPPQQWRVQSLCQRRRDASTSPWLSCS